jgi:hypothetical protein
LNGGVSTAKDVFINCPFDADYAPIFQALIFGVLACGFRPRSARELDDGGQARIEKLYGIIEDCRYGVHDLSRTELDPVNHLPRFNMPLELGIFLGAKRFGAEAHSAKRCLILDVEPWRYQRFISDLAGMDIAAHGGDLFVVLECLRDWLANVSRKRVLGSVKLVNLYRQFLTEKPVIGAGLGHDPQRIPYVDFERIVTQWVAAYRF